MGLLSTDDGTHAHRFILGGAESCKVMDVLTADADIHQW